MHIKALTHSHLFSRPSILFSIQVAGSLSQGTQATRGDTPWIGKALAHTLTNYLEIYNNFELLNRVICMSLDSRRKLESLEETKRG